MPMIEIDGKAIEAENGKMIIEVADEMGINIPRFCYHKKLSVAANCRMCLVQVENGRKPVPACATPITNGMKVFTKSEEAIRSQQAVMEFLLINHPLDCPICDQGGECELQDVSMGYGYDESEYFEEKRSIHDENLGPLISTDMTRCILCTRCVRFGEEVAGIRELGMLGRGEKAEISTFVHKSISSEVSGNIIDLCPVGALTSKPYRYKARPWELLQSDSIAPHDCLGSNVHLHVRRGQLMRVVPREKESINETWLSDRDRFSYLGLSSKARVGKPMIKIDGQWQTVEWEQALKFSAEGLSRIIKQHGPEQVAAFASPSATLEELYLLQKMMRELGVHNLDHRIQQTDFRDQTNLPILNQNSISYAEIDNLDQILLIGCNIDREVPLAGIRVRKAFRNGAKIYAINPVNYDFHFDVECLSLASPQEMPMHLAQLLLAIVDDVTKLPDEVQRLLIGLKPDKNIKTIAKAIKKQNSAIILGALAENHPDAALLRSLIHSIEINSTIKILQLTIGANSAGARLAGMLPHLGAGGKNIDPPGLDIQAALEHKLKAYVLHAVDPNFDFANPYGARQSMLAAEFVVALSAYRDDSILDYANVILPIAPYSETSGTYINVDNIWQTVKGASQPFEEARPAWKIIRVLANLLHCKEFNYLSSEEVLSEMNLINGMKIDGKYKPFYPDSLPSMNDQLVRIGEWPLYRSDSIIRHAEALQECAAAETACIKIHPHTAKSLKLDAIATISQGEIEITLPLVQDERIAPGTLWVQNALPETIDLGHSFAAITVKRSK
jgi:NADH-quinone oxidoreductase subunit G